MPRSSAYLFIEMSVLVYLLGFGWERWTLRELFTRAFWLPAVSLAAVWFAIDQVAVRLGIWAFPSSGTLHYRIFALPIEEYLLFFLHTLMCFVFLTWHSENDI